MPASGVIHTNGLVIFDAAANVVSPATAANASTTSIFGVSQDYAQGASDTSVRVIPFVPGQLWEVDCVNAAATTNLLLRHQVASDLLIRNVTSISETASTGVFLAYLMTGLTTGSGKLIGSFLQRVSVFGRME